MYLLLDCSEWCEGRVGHSLTLVGDVSVPNRISKVCWRYFVSVDRCRRDRPAQLHAGRGPTSDLQFQEIHIHIHICEVAVLARQTSDGPTTDIKKFIVSYGLGGHTYALAN